jgi:hypothetical protein
MPNQFLHISNEQVFAPPFQVYSGAISVQNAQHSTEVTPLTENSALLYGIPQA